MTDLALFSRRFQDLQDKITTLSNIAMNIDLKISKEKTKPMWTDSNRDGQINIEGFEVEYFDAYMHMVSRISQRRDR